MERHTRKYRISLLRSLACRMVGLFPTAWREPAAEFFVRRPGSPGPAAEHLIQYLLSRERRNGSKPRSHEAKVAIGADLFYEKQYRQFLNPTMGAFAATASQVVLGSGGEAKGRLWRRHRRTFAALLENPEGPPPLLVLNPDTVAVAVFLPRLKRRGEAEQTARWLYGLASMPDYFKELVKGDTMEAPGSRVNARICPAAAMQLEALDAALKQGRAALLALHPHDPDAMGLHITLFGVEAMWPAELTHRFGLEDGIIDAYREHACYQDRSLAFLVGATEEVFTQCSQNLFVKRPVSNAEPAPVELRTLDFPDFVNRQFEAVQITVSGSGLPGVSPRNGDLGHAAFAVRRSGRLLLLIPYHPGNAVHGHAAKLWSNPYGSVILSDDHDTLRRVRVSGPARTAPHDLVVKTFPNVAAEVMVRQARKSKAPAPPEYWFVQEVAELIVQRETLRANQLDPARPACSISAGGQALHNKKPGYFNADRSPAYDVWLQHQREASGLIDDPGGARNLQWREDVHSALVERQKHLERLQAGHENRPAKPWDHPDDRSASAPVAFVRETRSAASG